MALVTVPLPTSPNNPGGPIRRGTGLVVQAHFNRNVYRTPFAQNYIPASGVNPSLQNVLDRSAFLPDGRLVPRTDRTSFPPGTFSGAAAPLTAGKLALLALANGVVVGTATGLGVGTATRSTVTGAIVSATVGATVMFGTIGAVFARRMQPQP